MSDLVKDIPKRIQPYLLLKEVDEPVHILPGPFRLIGSVEGKLEGKLEFRWSPSAEVGFEGTYECPFIGLDDEQWFLAAEGDTKFRVPVVLTSASPGPKSSFVRGITADKFSVGEGPFEALRFCLANFPDYNGEPVRGRLEISTDSGRCRLDMIQEVRELAKKARIDAGFVISHVGLWEPSAGVFSVQDAESTLEMLHSWFGLLCGAWAGPLFPQGLDAAGRVVWRQFAPWTLRRSRPVSTWLPSRTRLNLSAAFRGFVQKWHDPVWNEPLRLSIAWYVEANGHEAAKESRIILAQVALELLSWVLLVEAQPLYSRADFDKISAAGRIRALLHHIRVSATIPAHLKRLQSLRGADAFDGPGVITSVRNGLVHSTEKKRKSIKKVDGVQRWECSELALQYLELAIFGD